MDVKLQNVRIAFCQDLFRPGIFKEGDKPRFTSTFLISKDDTEQLAKLRKAIIQSAKDKFGTKWEAKLKGIESGGNSCLRDGDTKAEYEGYAGSMFVNSASYSRPSVFNKDRSRLEESDGIIYGGCYVNALISIWVLDKPGQTKRICASLKGVQFVKDGDSFSGASAASENDFEDLSDIGNDEVDVSSFM